MLPCTASLSFWVEGVGVASRVGGGGGCCIIALLGKGEGEGGKGVAGKRGAGFAGMNLGLCLG